MTILARLTLLIALLAGGFAAVYWAADRSTAAELEELKTRVARERNERFRIAAEMQGRGIEALASSYAWWEDMVKFMDKPDSKWASDNVDNVVGIPGGGDAVWIVDPQFALLHTIDKNYARLPLPIEDLEKFRKFIAGKYTFRFFTMLNGRPWEIFGAAIQDANFWRHETPVRGYLLLGKEWDSPWLAQLNTLVGARLSLHPPAEPLTPHTFCWPLKDIEGRPLHHVEAQFNFEEVESTARAFDRQVLGVSLGAGVAVLLLLAFIGFVVLLPLNKITRSLETRLTSHLAGLLNSRSEFGEIARLLAGQLRWGHMLQEEMRRHLDRSNPDALRRDAESNEALRLRLAGNLHDGPIQTIYAAGLQVAALQSDLDQGRPPAKAQLIGVNRMLQQASTDLRNIILDLEPAELRERDLDTALRRIEQHFQQFARCKFALLLPDTLLDGFSREAQTQLYFICRELASNALRHAQPTDASLRFSNQSGFLRIEWQNDGAKPAATAGSGHGLRNIERRVADLGGTFQAGPAREGAWRAVCEIPFTSLNNPATAPGSFPR